MSLDAVAFEKFDPGGTSTVPTCLPKWHTVLAARVLISTGGENFILTVLGHSHAKGPRLARQARELVLTFGAFPDFFAYRERHVELFP
ncbi:MAG: hypothetical protein JRF37_02585 [Deltaproteobacteria bacterium]|nr:hypothetical protein [Deltaproteobacteria bacterium]